MKDIFTVKAERLNQFHELVSLIKRYQISLKSICLIRLSSMLALPLGLFALGLLLHGIAQESSCYLRDGQQRIVFRGSWG